MHRWDGILAEKEALGERRKKKREGLVEKKKGESLTAESATELQVCCFGSCRSIQRCG